MLMLGGISMVYKKLKDYGKLVMFSHTIFSLSFALIAILLVVNEYNFTWSTFAWVLLALLSARTGANALNRVIDAKIDVLNPRTASRQLPRKEISVKEVMVLVSVCFALMVFASYQINWLCFILSPVALALMTLYSYTKRFTFTCHLILGLTCACAPVGAILAFTGQFSWLAILIGAANMFWVAGFDVIYASQDYDFDKAHNLHSIPVQFGIKNGLHIAKLFHVFAFVALVIIGMVEPKLNFIYSIGLFMIGMLFIYQHSIISATNLKQVKVASYQVNQIISVVFLSFGVLAIIL